ncbi:stage VI sporulation protein F [Sutcliffiella cohnii]|uniref:Sporulation protein n=1 Tax=Sutcliffiella cohnii TaxID=33932 RepID=A0A223KMT5_9BACI|nr:MULTISPECIES: stage VI sporulation protein F [Sutcliffiella]AST90668.1 sporulation protein [Sutcliffiella cohnii]WBL16321.1 stage VI sporulation protein F [Sutcliffiella sp. NC1]
MNNNFFKGIEQKTGVNMKDVFELANSMQNANFKDEATVRGLVKRVAKLANRNVPQELEDKIVNTLINGDKPVDMGTISKMLNEKKK